MVLPRSCSDHYITLKYFFEKKYCSMTGITPRPELPRVTLLNSIFWQFKGRKSFQRLANMSHGLGQVFAHEICQSQSWTNFSYAINHDWWKCVFFRKMYQIQFLTISGGKSFQMLANMSNGLVQVFAHEICLSQSWTHSSNAINHNWWKSVFFGKMY